MPTSQASRSATCTIPGAPSRPSARGTTTATMPPRAQGGTAGGRPLSPAREEVDTAGRATPSRGVARPTRVSGGISNLDSEAVMKPETAYSFSRDGRASRQDPRRVSDGASSRRWLSLLLATLAMALTAGHAGADTVTEWNQTSIDVLKAGNVAGNPWSRCMAMVHVAIADAINTVQGRYTRYAVTSPAAPSASADAAVAAAARTILIQVIPGQKAKVEEAYAASLKQIPDGPAKTEGIAVGEQAAAVILADRANDATGVPDTYRPVTTPGVWVPTAPPLFPEYARAKGWVITSPNQFRPGPPPALTSALYARDYNEVKEIGAAKSTKPTPQQVEAVRF